MLEGQFEKLNERKILQRIDVLCTHALNRRGALKNINESHFCLNIQIEHISGEFKLPSYFGKKSKEKVLKSQMGIEDRDSVNENSLYSGLHTFNVQL